MDAMKNIKETINDHLPKYLRSDDKDPEEENQQKVASSTVYGGAC